MELTSEQALRADIATLTSEIASLTAKRNVLTHALEVIVGERIISDPPAIERAGYTKDSPGVTVTKPPERCGQIMVGSGTDTYDPTCDLDKGHKGVCKSYSAIDQHKLEKKGPGGHFTAYSAEELRDVVVQQEGDFTYVGIAEIVGRDRQTIRKYMKQLIDRGIVTVVGGTGMRSSPVTLRYNRDIPAGPNTHPREPTPEKNAIGATIAGSTVESNGRIVVRNTMIQGLVNAAYNQGWDVSFKDGSHLKFKSPDGRTVGVNAEPPSKQIVSVIKRDLKRSGLKFA